MSASKPVDVNANPPSEVVLIKDGLVKRPEASGLSQPFVKHRGEVLTSELTKLPRPI